MCTFNIIYIKVFLIIDCYRRKFCCLDKYFYKEIWREPYLFFIVLISDILRIYLHVAIPLNLCIKNYIRFETNIRSKIENEK